MAGADESDPVPVWGTAPSRGQPISLGILAGMNLDLNPCYYTWSRKDGRAHEACRECEPG